MESLTYWQLISQNRHFRNLLSGQVISELGNWFNFVAGLGLVRAISASSPEAAGALLLWRTLPFSLLTPIAGTLADRMSRRTLMLVTDVARAFVALLFLLADGPEDLWIVYAASILLSTLTAFFDAAKNAAVPNITGEEGILAGTALMFSSRFLLMAVGSLLGGWAAAFFGYKIAFIINAVSFLVSAYSVWLVPEEVTKEAKREDIGVKTSFCADVKEGWSFLFTHRFAMTIVMINLIWAIGGGTSNVIAERLGGVFFAKVEGWNADFAVGFLLGIAGAGLFLGMLAARRVSMFVESRNITIQFIGGALIVHGIFYALAGLMPTLWLAGLMILISRTIIGAEYALQETMFQRSLPDRVRGRILTIDRGAEITVFSVSGYLTGLAMGSFSVQFIAVLAGLVMGSSGLIWFLREGRFRKERERQLA
jgi:MFS family permease